MLVECNSGIDHMPVVSLRPWMAWPADSCCNSALAFFLLSLLNSEDFLLIFSSLRFLLLDLFKTLLLASLIAWGSLLLPPVLMDVVSKGVALSVTASPPEMSSWRTWVWNKPWTDSPLICVTRSPGLRPRNKIGVRVVKWVTCWNSITETHVRLPPGVTHRKEKSRAYFIVSLIVVYVPIQITERTLLFIPQRVGFINVLYCFDAVKVKCMILLGQQYPAYESAISWFIYTLRDSLHF